MEWSMLLVAAVIATAGVVIVHAMRRHPHVAGMPTSPTRRVTAEMARRAVEADAEAARKSAEDLSLEQRPRV